MADLKLALAIDANNPNIGDLQLVNGTIQLTQTLSEQVAQSLLIRLRFFQAEWFLDPTLGIPYFQTILGQKNALGIVAQIFRSAIISTPGVANVVSLVPTLTGRSLALSFQVRLNNGQTLSSSDFLNNPFVITVATPGPSGGAGQ